MPKKVSFKRKTTKSKPDKPERRIVHVEAVMAADDQVHLIAVADDGTVWGKLLTDDAWVHDPAHERFTEGTVEPHDAESD